MGPDTGFWLGFWGFIAGVISLWFWIYLLCCLRDIREESRKLNKEFNNFFRWLYNKKEKRQEEKE